MKEGTESLGSRSARTFSVLAAGRAISLLLGILAIIVVARLLGPQDYGVFTLAFAFFSLLSATSNFGFGNYLAKFLSESEDKRDKEGFARALASGYLWIIIIGILLTLLGIAISGWVASLFQTSGVSEFTLMLASTIIFFSMVYGTSDWALIGVGKNAAAITLEVAENIVLLAASVALIMLGYGPNGAIAGLLISYVFASLLGTYLIFRFAHRRMHAKIAWPGFKDLRDSLRFSFPVAMSNLLSNGVVNFAILFLGFFVSAYAIGNYGIAARASDGLSVFYGTAAVTLVPILSIAAVRSGKKRRRYEFVYNKTLLYSILTTVPLIIYLGVFSTPIIYLLVTHAFGSAPFYMSLIALGIVIGTVGIFTSMLFVARGKTSKLLVYGMITAAFQLLALLILTPLWGVTGEIIAVFFVGGIVSDYLFLRGVRKTLGVRTDYGKLARAFASVVVLALTFSLGLLSPNFAVELIYGLVVLLEVYPVFLVLLRVIEKSDIETIERSVKRLQALSAIVTPLINYFNFLIYHLQ